MGLGVGLRPRENKHGEEDISTVLSVALDPQRSVNKKVKNKKEADGVCMCGRAVSVCVRGTRSI